MTDQAHGPQAHYQQQEQQVYGDQYNAGRDILVLLEAGERDFFTPALEHYQPPRFIGPDIAPQFAERLRKRRLLLFGGDPTVHKDTLARHVVWRLNQLFTQEPAAPDCPAALPVKEWKRSGAMRLDVALHAHTARTIFILPQLLPQHINYDLQAFERILQDRQHFVVATSEDDTTWQSVFAADVLQRFWQNLQARALFPPDYLVDVLRNELLHSREKLPKQLLLGALKDHSLGRRSLRALAEELKTPENIADFVSLLCEGVEQGRTTELALDDYIKAAQDDLHRVRHWYHSLPGLRDQLLVLALHFFDGLLDDQFFAALEVLIERVWLRREESLRSLDYGDVDQLQKFFRYVPESGGVAIKTHLRDQRTLVLQVAWSTHRRHILSALPVFVQFIKDSVAPEPLDWSLYGSTERRERLRSVLTDTISDIGLRDVRAVEETLLRLAIDPQVGVQAVAARAIARWREYREAPRLFEVLTRWMDDGDTITIIKGIIKPVASASGTQPEDRLKVTMGLLIGYATQSDIPNRMSPTLYKALERLANDDNRYVRQCLCSFVLPLIVPLHFKQVQEIVVTLTRDLALHPAIVESMTQAYRGNPYAVASVLDTWYHQCLDARTTTREGLDADRRVALLACVSTVYGRLPCEPDSEPVHVEQVFRRMRRVLTDEQDARVRKAAMAAVIRQGRTYFARLKDIIPRISPEELNEVLDALVEIYLDERQQLPGGDQRLPVGKRLYPLWVNPWERPRTEVEREMLVWVQATDNTVTQQIGYRALIRFRNELDEEVLRRAESAAHERTSMQHPEERPLIVRPPRMTGLHPFDFFLYYVVAWMVTVGVPRYRTIIRGVLPEALQQEASFPDLTRALLRDCSLLSDDDIVEITGRLRSALGLAHRRHWLMVSAVVLVLVVGIGSILIGAGR